MDLQENITRAIRTYFTGKESHFVFRHADTMDACELSKIHLYLHIPFCKNLCPYCPYNKVPYDRYLASEYTNALLHEIDLYSQRWGSPDITSIYIGGGTPTLLCEELDIILEKLRKTFRITGEICIETNPDDISEKVLCNLKAIGADLVSVGVQSFQDRFLRFIGRAYSSSRIDESLAKMVQAGFSSINVDLLFALPEQTIGHVTYDLQKALDAGVHQITTYPLFTFPYTSIGHYLRLKQVRMPPLSLRKTLYFHIHDYLSKRGFEQVSVWGFKQGGASRYSSVTRDGYLGLGAGAGSHLPSGFYLNTFSVREYISRCLSSRFPTALSMHFTPTMQQYFWLYWRFYDTYIPKTELFERFDRDDKKLHRLLDLFKRFHLINEHDDAFQLTLNGAFWIHLLQNYFSLRYIDKIWSIAMNEAYPAEIVL